MIVSTATKTVVLRLANPHRVATVVPTARLFDHGEHRDLVAVPHRLDEIRVLNNMGIAAPSPIKYYYDWPGQYAPFEAQIETSSFLTLNPKAFVLNDMGTGKTLAALWAWDYLRSQGMASKLLVVSPLSTLERTWADEVFGSFPHLTVGVLHGTKDRRLKVLAGDYDVYVINHDGLGVIQDELVARTEIDTVIVDEVATFRNAGTKRWKTVNKVCTGRARVWGLTGTPTPNSPTDAWAQCRLIAPEKVPRYFGAFRDSVMRQQGPFKWTPRPGAADVVGAAMQPAIRFTREQCVDLPPTIYQTHAVDMSKEQKAAYKDMLNKLHLEYDGGQVLAVNEAVKHNKLCQIACGVVYGTKGEEVVLPMEGRMAVLREVIENAGTKTIVFIPFRAALERVAEELRDTYTVGVIHGGVSKSARDRVFSDFMNDKDPQVLVAQPASMSHGLTLTAANTIVWWSPVSSGETFEQANARIIRPGQKHTQFLVTLEGSAVERKIYERLRTRKSMQGLLLELLAA